MIDAFLVYTGDQIKTLSYPDSSAVEIYVISALGPYHIVHG